MSNFRIDVIPFTELRLADAVQREVRHMIQHGGEAPRLDESTLTGLEGDLNRMLQFVIVSFIEEGFSEALPISAEAVRSDPWVSAFGNVTLKNNGLTVPICNHAINFQWQGNVHLSWAVGMEVTGGETQQPVTCTVGVTYSGVNSTYPCVVPEGRTTLFGSTIIPARPKGICTVVFSLKAENGGIYVPKDACEINMYTTPSTGLAT